MLFVDSEVKAPVRSYTTSTTYNGEAFTYKAPLGLKVVNGSQELSLCNVGTDDVEGKDIFRCILVPSETEMTIEGQFQDGNVEVYFPAVNQEVKYTPAAGTYQGINIAYTYDYGTTGSTRDLKVGDYYYSDGSIYPGDLTGAPKDGCVGIIFSTTTSTTDQGHGWSHGYVIALKNTNDKVATYSRWGDATVILAGNALASGAALDNMDGYTASISTELSAIDAVKAAKEYSVSLPEGTSGWYLPSASQLAAVMNNLYTESGWKFDATNAYDNTNQSEKASALNAIQTIFENVGGVLLNADEFNSAPNSGITTVTDRWWSTTEVDTQSAKAWALEIKNNGQLKLLDRDKDASNASVRPVFAF